MYIIVNTDETDEFAQFAAYIAEHEGKDSPNAIEYANWHWVLPGEEPHTYHTLKRALNARDGLRVENDNNAIEVFEAVPLGYYDELRDAVLMMYDLGAFDLDGDDSKHERDCKDLLLNMIGRLDG